MEPFEKIRKLRKALNLTQQELAFELWINRASLSLIERWKQTLEFNLIQNLLGYLADNWIYVEDFWDLVLSGEEIKLNIRCV